MSREAFVALLVAALLAAGAIPAYRYVQSRKSLVDKPWEERNVSVIRKALAKYRDDCGDWPASPVPGGNDAAASLRLLVDGGYIGEEPFRLDPERRSWSGRLDEYVIYNPIPGAPVEQVITVRRSKP